MNKIIFLGVCYYLGEGKDENVFLIRMISLLFFLFNPLLFIMMYLLYYYFNIIKK